MHSIVFFVGLMIVGAYMMMGNSISATSSECNSNPAMSCLASHTINRGKWVEAHIRSFADKDGYLSYESIMLGHQCANMGNENWLSHLMLDIKARAIMNVLTDRFSPVNTTVANEIVANEIVPVRFTIDQLLTVVNPSRTRFWDHAGRFDSDHFEYIWDDWLARFQDKQGRVNRSAFDALLHINQVNSIATHVYSILPVPWSAVTRGSIDELFLYFGDQAQMHTKASLLEFYQTPDLAYRNRFHRVRNPHAL